MKKCIICGQRVNVNTEDYGCMTIRIPFINLKLWRFDFKHRKCMIK